MMNSKVCYHCGQLGHVHANCPYHALLTATTEEERIFAEQQIHQALKAVGGQGWRGQINRTETKINLEDQQNKQNQEDNLDTEIKSNGDNLDNDVQSNKEKVVSYEIVCFRCGRSGHTSKECKFEGKDAVAVAMQLCELISRCLVNSHFYTLKYLVRLLRKLAFDKSESTMRKNLEQLVHHFSPLIIQYNEEGADDMRRMVEQTRVKKAFLLYLLMFLPISPQEAQVF
ncbi:MAG: hypothetical protein EZS28_029256, partial [Streblomastix strix]